MLEKGNYLYNSEIQVPPGLICDQSLSGIGRMRFGLMPVSRVGSGVVAAYDLFTLLNRPMPAAEVLRDVYLKARTPLGLFGVHPDRLIRCFSSRYIPAEAEKSKQAAAAEFTPGCVGIVIWWTGKKNFSRLRFAALENDGGRILVYNRIIGKGGRDEFSSFADVAEDKRFHSLIYVDTVGSSYN